MSSKPPPERISPSPYATSGPSRANPPPSRFEDPATRQQRLQRTGSFDPWLQGSSAFSGISASPSSSSFPTFAPQTQRLRDEWINREPSALQELRSSSPWPGSPLTGQYPNQTPMSFNPQSPQAGYPGWSNSWPAPLLRRTSSEDARLSQYGGSYYGGEASSSVPSLSSKAYPQRRPSNRDEFDGPSQLLEKPDDAGYEPKEEDLPQLPINLYAQEQDEILSQVNDRLSQCAFDFVAKYQFPIPIEPDKRPVRVPNDREWSEWVYLLKRLATKRRIPARVLYNGQIKQLITILENSLEMRHAAKHQSRPLKDDRNILQLISSGLQVAKILKDARAMQRLDGLYVQTERVIQGRRATAQGAFGGTMCIM
ncbi:uncharacterized protein LTR77_002251 [Saxophila tyrrhenica]|uniref:Uncharacterized protein n=1 Tax=Saxophila tyrrhenica TaxID=1690608 RepID=A0AAV9PIN0_9PEZI|nr:hypothetical protein LTR77_002251 [Saxophila tyrrhenica]